MKFMVWPAVLLIIAIVILYSCNSAPKEKTDKEIFEEILNNPDINSKEVGEREGIKYFQVVKNGKTGFRDLDGNIVIEPKFDNAEMFSEGFSTVQIGEKYGIINEKGNYVLPLQNYEYVGSVHDGLASYQKNDKYGFINIKGEEIIKPQYEWVDEFSEGLCAVRNTEGKHGYIDKTGKLVIDFQYEYANKFENGQAKVGLNNLWGAIDKSGQVVVPITHKYTSDF